MFGGLGNNNTTAKSSGLFGQPAAGSGSTGFNFGGSSSNQNGAGSTTGLGSSGGLFGNNTNNTASNGTSNTVFGNNSGTNTGGLFGNKNTNSTIASSNGVFGTNNSTAKSNGLFGTNNSTTATNGGGLFGNNNSNNTTASGSLFGNTTSQPASGGLFGNKSASNTTTGGLFGSTNTSNPTSTGSNTSSGLFGNSSSNTKPASSNSLFGSTLPNQNSTLQNNNSIGTFPTKQYNVNDLPKPLTSTRSNKIVQHSSIARKRSLSNSSPIAAAQLGKSSILERLGKLNTLSSNDTYASEGLFSSRKEFIQSVSSSEKFQDRSKRVAPRVFSASSKPFSTRNIRSHANPTSDFLKLKVDSNRTEARRLKLFGSSGGAQKVRILGRETEPETEFEQKPQENSQIIHAAEKEAEKEDTQQNHEQDNDLAAGDATTTDAVATEATEEGYWCSPSIDELSNLPLRQFSEIPDFSIGRKGYGSIRFELPVDLTAFWSDLPGYLFGDVVRFNKNKTVEVYPNGGVPLGTGLNVPATITLEKVFPVSKSKAQDPITKSKEISLFVKKLKELKDMEFITYDPINGVWTFKVKHFSIWGLVDEDAAVVEDIETENPNEAEAVEQVYAPNGTNSFKHTSKPQLQNVKSSISVIEDTFVYKRHKELPSSDNTTIMPGSFLVDDSSVSADYGLDKTDKLPPITENILSDDELIEDGVLDANIPSGFDYNPDDSFTFDAPVTEDIDEKQFEPQDLDIGDFNILEADPKLATDDNWDRQLVLSSHFDSAFVSAVIPRTTIHETPFSKTLTPGELDKLLYGDFEKVIKSQKKIKEELRLSPFKFSRFTSDNNLLIKDSTSISSTSVKSISTLFVSPNSDLISAIYKKHLLDSKIVERSNGFPKSLPNERLNFKFITEVYDGLVITEGKDIWDLASVLFDDLTYFSEVPSIADVDVSNRILEIKRREGLLDWIRMQIHSELEANFEEASDIFEQIFLLLVTAEIPSAAKLAIKTKNPHLAVLISLLGSNDPEVKYSATKQVESWKKSALLHTIPKGLLKIYYLLQGNVLTKDTNVDLSKNLSWKAKFGLLLSYGDLNQSISSLISSFIATENIENAGSDIAFLSLLKLYTVKYEGQSDIQAIFNSFNSGSRLDATLQWYIYEVLVRSTNQIAFGLLNGSIGDKLTLVFAEQLTANGLYSEAIFVLSHLENDELAKSTISRIVTVNIKDFVEEIELTSDLSNNLNVPKKLIREARALHYRFIGEPWKEADALLDAGDYEEAHKTIINKVAPSAVINNGSKLDALLVLINRFPEHYTNKDWATGLAIYKNYIQFSKTISDAPLKYLVENVPLVSQSNYKIKIAVRLISKAVVQRVLEILKKESLNQIGLKAKSILRLPLGEDALFFSKLLKTNELSKLRPSTRVEVL